MNYTPTLEMEKAVNVITHNCIYQSERCYH